MISLPTKLDRKHLLIMSYTLIAFVIGLAVRWVTDNLLKKNTHVQRQYRRLLFDRN